MTPGTSSSYLGGVADRWWALVIRGIVAIALGIFVIANPGSGLLALVFVWGTYAFIDGILSLALAAKRGSAGLRWGWWLFEGIVGIASGVLAFTWPGITSMALLIVIAFWAVLTGIAEIASAIQLRRYVKGEWMLAATGVLSIAFGVLLMVYPSSGALAVVWLIGAYAILFGLLEIGLGLRLNRMRRETRRVLPTGGMPTPV